MFFGSVSRNIPLTNSSVDTQCELQRGIAPVYQHNSNSQNNYYKQTNYSLKYANNLPSLLSNCTSSFSSSISRKSNIFGYGCVQYQDNKELNHRNCILPSYREQLCDRRR